MPYIGTLTISAPIRKIEALFGYAIKQNIL